MLIGEGQRDEKAGAMRHKQMSPRGGVAEICEWADEQIIRDRDRLEQDMNDVRSPSAL